MDGMTIILQDMRLIKLLTLWVSIRVVMAFRDVSTREARIVHMDLSCIPHSFFTSSCTPATTTTTTTTTHTHSQTTKRVFSKPWRFFYPPPLSYTQNKKRNT